MLEKLFAIIRKKPLQLSLSMVGYLLVTGLLKWGTRLDFGAIWYLLGGGLGIYFLDIAEEFVKLRPSPFRSIIFVWAFSLVAAFVVSSSDSAFGKGLILVLYLTLLYWQVGEWRIRGNLDSWYNMVSGTVSGNVQKLSLVCLVGLFGFLTFIFVR